MKIRLKDNTIRIRLSRDEVNVLVTNGLVGGATFLSPQKEFKYALKLANSLRLTFLDHQLTVEIPEESLEDWDKSDMVGFTWSLPITNRQEKIQLTIEKDFRCLKSRVGEDETNLYDHPDQKTPTR